MGVRQTLRFHHAAASGLDGRKGSRPGHGTTDYACAPGASKNGDTIEKAKFFPLTKGEVTISFDGRQHSHDVVAALADCGDGINDPAYRSALASEAD